MHQRKLEKPSSEPSITGPFARSRRQTVLVSAISLALGGQVLAADIRVGGGCSLVDAITAANVDSATGACSAGFGADAIIMPESSITTLTAVNNDADRPNGLPSVTSVISVQGNGSTIERGNASGTPDFRIFHVAASGDLTLHNLDGGRGLATHSGFGRRRNPE